MSIDLEAPAPPDPYSAGRVDERARIVATIRARATLLRLSTGDSEKCFLSTWIDALANDIEAGATA